MFKNAVVFRFSKPLELSSGDIESRLRERAFRPLLPVEASFCGFVSPLGDEIEGAPLVHIVDGRLLVCLCSAVKLIRPAELRHRIELRVAEIEAAEHRKVFKKERENIKDAVLMDMLPNAFPDQRRQLAYITPRTGLIVIEAASAKSAEMVSSVLREALGGLAVQAIECAQSPALVMADWLRESRELPGCFSLGSVAHLCGKDPAERRSVKLVNEDPQCDQAIDFLKATHDVKSLQFLCGDGLPGFSFVLSSDLIFSSIKPDSAFQDEAEVPGDDDDNFAKFKVAQIDAQFVLFAGVFDRFFAALVDAFGGYELGREPVPWVPNIDLLESLAADLAGWKIKSGGLKA